MVKFRWPNVMKLVHYFMYLFSSALYTKKCAVPLKNVVFQGDTKKVMQQSILFQCPDIKVKDMNNFKQLYRDRTWAWSQHKR